MGPVFFQEMLSISMRGPICVSIDAAYDLEWAQYSLRGCFRCLFVGPFKSQQMLPVIPNGPSILSGDASDIYAWAHLRLNRCCL